ncbi:hypothetical protein J1614_004447 [Plenodomus biglobosus]|nr:hypothetical protein J1614_004447 [Plenodomus biglobosus]
MQNGRPWTLAGRVLPDQRKLLLRYSSERTILAVPRQLEHVSTPAVANDDECHVKDASPMAATPICTDLPIIVSCGGHNAVAS